MKNKKQIIVDAPKKELDRLYLQLRTAENEDEELYFEDLILKLEAKLKKREKRLKIKGGSK